MKIALLFLFGILTSYVCYSQEWTLATGFPKDVNVYCISYDTNTAYAVGFSPLEGKGCTVYSSSNKGSSWTPLCEVPDLRANYILVNKGRLILTGYADDGYIMCYSDDKGKTWKLANGIGRDKLFSSVIRHKNRLLSICGIPGNYDSYISEDNGESWHKYFTFPSECEIIAALTSNNNSLVAVIFSQDRFSLINSSDDGTEWALSSINVPLQPISGACGTVSDFYVTGQLIESGKSVVCISKDEGKSFSSYETLPKDISLIHSISSVENRLFLVASSPNNELLVFYKTL